MATGDVFENEMRIVGAVDYLRGLVGKDSVAITPANFKSVIGIAISTGIITVSGLTIRATANDYFVEIAIRGIATEDIRKDVSIPGVNLATQTGAMWKNIFPGISTRNYNVIYIGVPAGTIFGENNTWDVSMYSRF